MAEQRTESLLQAKLGEYQGDVDKALEKLQAEQIEQRIWTLDHTVWKPDPEEITNRLGWLRIAEKMLGKVGELQALADEVRSDGYTDVVLLGMGGSSLAPELFGKVFGGRMADSLKLAVLDSTVPGAVLAQAERADLARTLFIVSTKSGGTVETLSFFKTFYNLTAAVVGEDEAGRHFVAITDPGSVLQMLAEQYAFRTCFLNDPNIGGRFSALSYFGLVPAALVGVDIEKLLHRASGISRHWEACAATDASSGANLGAIIGMLASAGRDKLTFAISPSLSSVGDWAEQLIAESLGKEGKGIVPVVGEPLAEPEAYGTDRLFVHLRLDGDATHDEAVQQLETAGFPVILLTLSDTYDLGRHFMLWEMATAVAGHLLGVNPFDQPDVEAAKVLARQAVASYRESGRMQEVEPAPWTENSLAVFLAQATQGDYIALQAYVEATTETDQALLRLRTRMRDSRRLATTVGYGPRFLHSTGQLHKGDRGNGLFIQLTADDPQDLPIPDRAGHSGSAMSFGVLKMAQVLGDGKALTQAGRRVTRLHLGSDAAASIREMAQWL